MATDASQILSAGELENKLGGSSGLTSYLCPNRSQIASIWSNVYFLASGSNILLNNGQIWPTKRLKKGQTQGAAYNSSTYETLNFRDEEWDSGEAFVYGTNCKAYNGTSYASNGYYYMEDTTNKWYLINSSGNVINTGVYELPYFSFNSSTVQLGTAFNASTTVGYSTNSNPSVISRVEYDLDGGVGGSSNISMSFNGGTATINRNSSYDSSYPMVVITAGVTDDTDKVLVYPPWSLSASDITNVSSNGATVTPVVSTNMEDYTLSSNKSWATVNGVNIVVSSNASSSSRSATITVTSRINGAWGGIEYDSGNKTTTLTLTQLGYTQTLYVVAYKSNPTKVYLSKRSDIVDEINAPARITIIDISVESQNYNIVGGEATIYSYSNNANITWDESVSRVLNVLYAGDVSWSSGTAPSGYQIDPTVHWN